jgi:hypothetical protein
VTAHTHSWGCSINHDNHSLTPPNLHLSQLPLCVQLPYCQACACMALAQTHISLEAEAMQGACAPCTKVPPLHNSQVQQTRVKGQQASDKAGRPGTKRARTAHRKCSTHTLPSRILKPQPSLQRVTIALRKGDETQQPKSQPAGKNTCQCVIEGKRAAVRAAADGP